MKVQNYHELLSAYHRYLEDKGVLNKFLDYQNFVNGFIADNNLAFAKPEPLAKNKQTKERLKPMPAPPKFPPNRRIEKLPFKWFNPSSWF